MNFIPSPGKCPKKLHFQVSVSFPRLEHLITVQVDVLTTLIYSRTIPTVDDQHPHDHRSTQKSSGVNLLVFDRQRRAHSAIFLVASKNPSSSTSSSSLTMNQNDRDMATPRSIARFKYVSDSNSEQDDGSIRLLPSFRTEI